APSCSLFCQCCGCHLDPHSFPTRRSSDLSGPCLIKGCFSVADRTHRSKRSIRCRAYMHWSHVTAKPVFITKMKLSVYMKHFKCIRKTRLKSFIAVTDPAGSKKDIWLILQYSTEMS